MRNLITLITILLTACAVNVAQANDTVVSFPAGGIKFMQEENVSLESETLFISKDLIEVDYVFLNNTDSDVVVEVGFPLPEYKYMFDVIGEFPPNFNDFTIEVNGKPVSYNKKVRAMLDGRDVTDILVGMGISVQDFSGYDPSVMGNYFERLSKEERDKLEEFGLVEADSNINGWPKWTVSTVFHWTQVFPAGREVSVKHTYAPRAGGGGYSYFPEDACLDEAAINWTSSHDIKQTIWVEYILSTGGNWLGTIKNFHLILERDENEILSLCWDYDLNKTGPGRFESIVEDFVPENDLKVFYYRTVYWREL